MEKLYTATRHFTRTARRKPPRDLIWGIVCLCLIGVMFGLWAQSQSLAAQNSSLRNQLASAVTPDDTCQPVGSWTAGESREQTLKVGTLDRRYIVHIPQHFVPSHYYPLVLFYVGRGADAKTAEAAYNLDSFPAIIVYPVPTIGDQNMTAWEGAPYSSGADDIAFTSSILDTIQTNLCIDRTRIYATGMSNGGGFAALLSCKMPDRFAAYAIDAGALYSPESNCRPPKPTPLISIHGDQDHTVPYFGSLLRQLPPIEDWVTMRASYNGCKQQATTYEIANVVATTWKNCQDGATVENLRVEGGGHVWGAVPNSAVWQFLSQFSI